MRRERRRFHRASQSFNVRCRHYGALTETWHLIASLDLSAGGMRFRSEGPFELGCLLEFEISLPNASEPLVVRGRLLRSEVQERNLVEHAVEFLDVQEEAQIQLDGLVAFLRKKG